MSSVVDISSFIYFCDPYTFIEYLFSIQGMDNRKKIIFNVHGKELVSIGRIIFWRWWYLNWAWDNGKDLFKDSLWENTRVQESQACVRNGWESQFAEFIKSSRESCSRRGKVGTDFGAPWKLGLYLEDKSHDWGF